MSQRRVLLACPQMAELAAEVASRSQDIKLGQIDWPRFPDGFPNLHVHDVDGLIESHVSFLACFDSPAVIFEQWSVMRHVAKLKPQSFRILLPYFPTGTMERSDHEGQVATAATLSALLSALPPSGPGPIPLYLWDVHALQNRYYFGDNVVPRFKTGLKLLFTAIKGRKVTIVFPDDGAKKRFGKMQAFVNAQRELGFRVAVCRKERGEGDSRRVVLAEGDVRGQDCIIVDDLVHSGGTLIASGVAALEAGATSVEAYVTHAVLENDNWKKFDGSIFRKFITTNSCPATARAVAGNPLFDVRSLADSITNAIRQQ